MGELARTLSQFDYRTIPGGVKIEVRACEPADLPETLRKTEPIDIVLETQDAVAALRRRAGGRVRVGRQPIGPAGAGTNRSMDPACPPDGRSLEPHELRENLHADAIDRFRGVGQNDHADAERFHDSEVAGGSADHSVVPEHRVGPIVELCQASRPSPRRICMKPAQFFFQLEKRKIRHAPQTSTMNVETFAPPEGPGEKRHECQRRDARDPSRVAGGHEGGEQHQREEQEAVEAAGVSHFVPWR